MASQLNIVRMKVMVEHPWTEEASFTIDGDSVTMHVPDESDTILVSLLYNLARIPGCMGGSVTPQTVVIQFLEYDQSMRMQTMVTAGSVISTFTGQGKMFVYFE